MNDKIEAFRCPRHEQEYPKDFGLDYWQIRGSDRCCSYCGSWHSEEFLTFLSVAADPDKPEWIEQSTKSYKIYIHRPEVEHAGHGAIKFYKWHLPGGISDEMETLYREALEVSFRKMMAQIDRWCLDMGMRDERGGSH